MALSIQEVLPHSIAPQFKYIKYTGWPKK